MSYADDKELRKAEEELRKKAKEKGESMYAKLSPEDEAEIEKELGGREFSKKKLTDLESRSVEYMEGEVCYVLINKSNKHSIVKRYSDVRKFALEIAKSLGKGMRGDEIDGFKEIITANGDIRKEPLDWKSLFVELIKSFQ